MEAVTLVICGAEVFITIALLSASEFPPPSAGKVKAAVFPALSFIEPPFNDSAEEFTYSRSVVV